MRAASHAAKARDEYDARGADQPSRCDCILVLTSRTYDFTSRAELPPHVTYVSPEIADPSWASPMASPYALAFPAGCRR